MIEPPLDDLAWLAREAKGAGVVDAIYHSIRARAGRFVQALAVKLHDEYVFVEVANEMARALGAMLGADLCTAGRSARELSRRLTTEP